MLLVEVTSESPTDEAETKASAPTEENNTTATIHNNTQKENKDNAKERIATESKVISEGAVSTIQINANSDTEHSDTDEDTKPAATREDDESYFDERMRIAVVRHQQSQSGKRRIRSVALSPAKATDSNQQDETDKLKASFATFVDAEFSDPSYVKSRTSQRNRRVAMCDYQERKSNRRSETGYVGLVNQAMTCYLNSLLQALYMTPEFRNALYNWEYVNDSEKDETKSIPYQMQKLFLNLQTSSKNAIETTSLTRSFGWDSTEAWQQHDIQELCRVMFDALEQKFKNTAQADLINRLYEGKMIDYVKCLECGTEKSREDSFLDIPLPVRPFGSNVAYGSVEEALVAFVQPETLDGTNQYHCETCNKKCDAHKGLKFTKFPYFLTLHLKRFAFDYNTFHRIKLNDAVTFPDLLNLNSFIPSTASEDASDENSSQTAAVKSEDGSTADSGNIDDDCPAVPCNNGISANEGSTSDNCEDDEDEGIERSNGPSTSNCHSQNHDDEKNRENLPGPKGPYVYELFSIMIHSGSASGGHYYAYIKDFKTGKWLCFNDQNVSPITNDDIQKTYGGGPLRAYYSGVYSSSSNAYMLMYRQIDPARNTLPMQVADFPKHLQKLLTEMQNSEDNDMKNRKMPPEMYSLKVFCHHPVKKTTECETLYGFHNTLANFTDRAYDAFNLAGVVDRDQVRLVTYQENTGLINCSFEDLENEPVRVMHQMDFLLEIRKKDESFKIYSPRGIAKNVYAIDTTTRQVTKGPINVRGYPTQTIQEYKEQSALAFGMESKDINLIFFHTDFGPRVVTDSEDTLDGEVFDGISRVFVLYSSSPDSEKSSEIIDEILNMSCTFMTFNVQLPGLSEEALRALGIPSLDKKRIQDATPSTIQPPKSVVDEQKSTDKMENSVKTTKSNDGDDSSAVSSKATSSPAQMDVEDWHTPEQSNSEDSSLSYSDRTLVGEGDASEDEDYPLANIDHEVSNQTNQDSNQCPNPREYLYKITRDEQEPDKLLRVLVEGQMVLSTLKKVLEPYVGVPSEYFRVFRQPDGEIEYSRLSMKTKFYDDGATMWIQPGIALRDDEFKASLYQLCLDSETEPFRFLCERTFSNDATVAQTKREILVELKKKHNIDIPFERCRLRLKFNDTAGIVVFDEQKMKDIRSYPRFSREIIIQELPGKEPVKKSSDIVGFAKRIPTSDSRKAPPEEFVLEGRSMAELREKILQLSGIPDEHLEIARGGVTLPDDVGLLLQRKRLEFSSEGNDDCRLMCIEDGVFIYYRDRRESQIELCPSELQDCYSRKTPRDHVGVISRRTRYNPSPRNERSLKIYFDDM